MAAQGAWSAHQWRGRQARARVRRVLARDRLAFQDRSGALTAWRAHAHGGGAPHARARRLIAALAFRSLLSGRPPATAR